MSAPAVGSAILRLSFVGLALFVATLFVAAVYWSARRGGVDRRSALRRGAIAAAASAAWIAVTGVAAARGALHFEAPPTMLALFPAVLAIAFGLALSPLGKQIALGLPLAALVGYQGFRVLVELLLHRAYVEGLMPVQMSYAGRNFDIITGVTALMLGAWLATGERHARAVIFVWNTLGLALLVNVVVVAILSAPTPLRVFMNEPANVWITHAPWVWLPAVLVLAALSGHVLVYRRLANESAATVPAIPRAGGAAVIGR
jgi:hypothetical protein